MPNTTTSWYTYWTTSRETFVNTGFTTYYNTTIPEST